jgi:Thaumatin family
MRFVWILFLSVASASTVSLVVTNQCSDTVWPAVGTQAGQGPSDEGFELAAGDSKNLSVSPDWNGRVWARTNCTFDGAGAGTCGTGDCGGNLTCTATVRISSRRVMYIILTLVQNAPATLAEFNLPGYENMSFYDISLVDGYNLPLAIQVILPSKTHSPNATKANETNPMCIGSVDYLAPETWNPYANGAKYLSTSSSNPLPFDNTTTASQVSSWCPSDLQQNPSGSTRPPFNPCLSACVKYQTSEYCCSGKHASAKKCGPNYYAMAAKSVCPDAYSYAFDDKSSTFAVPMGTGFEVIFCPVGRSTMIQKALGNAAHPLGSGTKTSMVYVTVAISVLFLSWG